MRLLTLALVSAITSPSYANDDKMSLAYLDYCVALDIQRVLEQEVADALLDLANTQLYASVITMRPVYHVDHDYEYTIVPSNAHMDAHNYTIDMHNAALEVLNETLTTFESECSDRSYYVEDRDAILLNVPVEVRSKMVMYGD